MAFGLKKFLGKEDSEEEYMHIDVNSFKPAEEKVVVKPFVLKGFEDTDVILNSLREGYTIAVIDIKHLKTKDIIELKRAVSKIKKTVEALEGGIAGFGDNILIATPQFAQIQKPVESVSKQKPDFIGSKF